MLMYKKLLLVKRSSPFSDSLVLAKNARKKMVYGVEIHHVTMFPLCQGCITRKQH
jgi:hypothetical protein